jgi:hypothetical protein
MREFVCDLLAQGPDVIERADQLEFLDAVAEEIGCNGQSALGGLP